MSLDLVTEFQAILRRDFKVRSADTALLTPDTTQALESGQFVARVVGGSEVLVDPTASPAWTGSLAEQQRVHQLFVERGRFDTQAISKVTTLWSFPYEAITNAYSGTVTAGDPLTVDVGAEAGVTDLRLVLQTAATGELVVGWAITGNGGAAPLGTTNIRYVYTGPSHVLP